MEPTATDRSWRLAIAALGVGVPLVVCAGLVATLTVSLMVAALLPEGALWVVWLSGAAVTSVALWLLVRRTVRFGRWRTLFYGLLGASIVADACYVLGSTTQSERPGVSGMAGSGWVFAAYLLWLALIVAFAMGAVVLAMKSPVAERRRHGV